jgi:hypothetical protein
MLLRRRRTVRCPLIRIPDFPRQWPRNDSARTEELNLTNVRVSYGTDSLKERVELSPAVWDSKA